MDVNGPRGRKFEVIPRLLFGAARVMCAWLASGLGSGAAEGAGGPRGAGFTRLGSGETGIHFTNRVSLEAVARNRLIEDGSGVAAGDVDGDGRGDLYFCSLGGGNRLYRNLGGFRFADVTRASGVECGGQASTGAVFADLDGDGDLDLAVNGLGTGTRLFLNDGAGRFLEVGESGLRRDTGARSLAVADVDGDGDLDLYVANYRTTTSRDEARRIRLTRSGRGYEVPVAERERFIAEADETGAATLLELGEPDVLYRNEGGGRFSAVSWTGGRFLGEDGRPLTEPPRDWGLSAMFHDLNQDGAPDLYVCNDFHTPDRVWLNDGTGRFRAAPATALRKHSWASMAVDFADLNGDGRDEFFVAEMLGSTRVRRQVQRDNLDGPAIPSLGWGWGTGEVTQPVSVMRNTLYLNQGGGHFAEMAFRAGVQASDWTWSAAFLDVDLDGYPDLLIANGHVRDHVNSDVQARLASAGAPRNAAERAALFGQIPSLAVAKRAFRNRGDLTFEDASAAWGFDAVGVSTALAMADLDGDGDLDVVLSNMDDGPWIMRNDATGPRLLVRARGRAPNTAGIGARIEVRAPGLPLQSQEIVAGGRYLSGDEAVRVFAVREAGQPLTVEVSWRSGRRSRLTNAVPDGILTVEEPGEPVPEARRVGLERGTNWDWYASFPRSAHFVSGRETVVAGGRVWFEDRSGPLDLVDAPEAVDDGARQSLLPWKRSHGGPGLACFDVNGDGHDDVLLPGGRSQPMRLRLNDGTGHFSAGPDSLRSLPSTVEQPSVVGWSTGLGGALLLCGITSGEPGVRLPVSLGLQLWRGTNLQAAGGLDVGPRVGPMAAADLDGDGDLDVFVGGQAEVGRYPSATASVLLRQAEGRLVPDQGSADLFGTVGLVNGAVWSDLDGDGWPELILACEWGPIRVFRNDHGRLRAWDPTTTWAGAGGRLGREGLLSRLTGWWNGVATGDFNGDGRLDIVALNWGRNTAYEEHLAGGLRLHHGDLLARGSWDLIESHWDAGLGREVPGRGLRAMSRAFPSLLANVGGYEGYATNRVGSLFGAALERARTVEVAVLDSVMLLNHGDRFEVRSLPMEAQLAPGFSPVVADFDGDGYEDVFLSQNTFATDREAGRLDAGRGLLWRGDGRGDGNCVAPDVSGLVLAGEQRGAATADFDEDGRPDLVVAQHGARVRLLMNRGGRPGLRVRLVGPARNRSGIGAQVRMRSATSDGPVREIHAGSGYFSQDSAVVILAKPAGPFRLWTRWPGGRTTEIEVPEEAREVSVDFEGKRIQP